VETEVRKRIGREAMRDIAHKTRRSRRFRAPGRGPVPTQGRGGTPGTGLLPHKGRSTTLGMSANNSRRVTVQPSKGHDAILQGSGHNPARVTYTSVEKNVV